MDARINYTAEQINEGIRRALLSSKKVNFTAISEPAITDDLSKGYDVGSFWYNHVTTKFYICEDNAYGAAIWQAIGASSAEDIGYTPHNGLVSTNVQDALDELALGGGSYAEASDPATNAAVTKTIIDNNGGVKITLTTAGNSQTMASPTNPNKAFTVLNLPASTHPITVIHGSGLSTVIEPGSGIKYFWDGSYWSMLEGVDASEITYIPGVAGLVSKNTQAAIEELALRMMPAFALASNTITPSTTPLEFGTVIPTISIGWTYNTDYTIQRLPLAPTFELEVSDTVAGLYTLSIAEGADPAYSTTTTQEDSAHSIAYINTVSATVAVTRTYTLIGTGDNNLPIPTYAKSITWGFKTYWGHNALATLDAAAVAALDDNDIYTTQSQLFTNYTISTSGVPEYLYICIPAGFADLTTFWVGGIQTTFEEQVGTVTVPCTVATSSSNYKIYKSLYPTTGSNITVSITA